jgi:hypothetical protein
VDQRRSACRANVRARCLRPRWRRRRVCRRTHLRADDRRDAAGLGAARLGARGAGGNLPGRHDDGDGRAGSRVCQRGLGPHPALFFIRGASPLGLPCTLSRARFAGALRSRGSLAVLAGDLGRPSTICKMPSSPRSPGT